MKINLSGGEQLSPPYRVSADHKIIRTPVLRACSKDTVGPAPSASANGHPPKNKKAFSYQDEKTRYHLISPFSYAEKDAPRSSCNGLTRRALNAAAPMPTAAHTHRLTGDLLPLPQGLAPTVLSLRGHSGHSSRSTPYVFRLRSTIAKMLGVRRTPTRGGLSLSACRSYLKRVQEQSVGCFQLHPEGISQQRIH